MAARLDRRARRQRAGVEHVVPNVSGGVDFATNPASCEKGGGRRAERRARCQSWRADPQRDRHYDNRPGGGSRRGRWPFADQHVPRHGGELAAAPAIWAIVLGGLSGPAIKRSRCGSFIKYRKPSRFR